MTLDGRARQHSTALSSGLSTAARVIQARRQREPEIGSSDTNASRRCCGATYFYSYVMVSLPLLQCALYVANLNSRAISTYLQPEMHTNHISADAHEPFFSLAIEGRLTVHDLAGPEAFVEFEILEIIPAHEFYKHVNS